jgi:lipid II:glycine glycyltransferase (peptidoglycan interpeptide bridge formation enzyme)
MQIVTVADAAAWDRALLALPNPHLLQSWAWGQFKARHGWSARRLLFQEGGRTVAAASLLRRRLPWLPLVVLYVPRGPALDWGEPTLVGDVLARLEALAHRERAIFIKIDPDVYEPDGAPAFSPRPANAPQVAGLLAARGWRPSAEQIQFRNTVLLDLRPGEEALLAAMKAKTRYNVRLAARRGVEVEAYTGEGVPPAALEAFYGLYAETAQRDGFPLRPLAYYGDAWGSFLQADLAHLLLARRQGEALAGLILYLFGPTAWYLYGASSERHRECMPNNLLQWEAMCRARATGCTLYDLWGAPDLLDEADPMWGVVRFKLGLGGELARGLGAWDFPVQRPAYWLYGTVIPRYLGWLRARSQNKPARTA